MDKIGRIYKGEDFDLEIKVPISGDVYVVDLRLYTDCNISFRPQNITVSGNTIKVHCEDHDLDLLNDGVLKYYLKYQNYVEYIKGGDVDERIEDIINTNTMHYLKTREGYDAITPEDIYNWGKQAQKDAMTEITITQNGTYTREDGYSSVIVNVEGGGSCNMQRKNYNITSNGTTTITPDAGYDGITGGTITVNVPTGGRLQDKDTTIFSLQNGNRVYTIMPDAGYDGMRSIDVELCSYSPSPFNMFRFVLYFDSTQDEYYIFNPLAGYNLQEVLDFKVDGLSDNSPYTFQKNTSHSFSLVAPNVTTLLENFKYAWPNGGYLVMWYGFTSYNDVVPAIYVDGVDNMSYQTTNMTLIDSCVVGPVYAQNVLSLSFSGGNGEMLFASKDSINFPNCNEIYIYDPVRTPCVINYHNGDKFTLADSGTVYVPDDEYISDMYNDDASGRRKFVSLLPDGWTCQVIPSLR